MTKERFFPSWPSWPLEVFKLNSRTLSCALALFLYESLPAQAQLPFMNAGPDSAMAQIDFAQIYLDTGNRAMKRNADQKEQRQHLVAAGVVSALDLDAPPKAIDEYNRAATLLKQQKSKEAIVHLHKAIAAYPKFVTAHNTLGLAYLDQHDGRAQDEFQAAAKLDDKFAGSFLNLGMLALSANDFASAQSELSKAASLKPKDASVLMALAFAQNGDHQYEQTLETTEQVHALDHRGMANVHYIAASAALSLKNMDAVRRELNLFLGEDPTNPLAPVARKNLDVLTRQRSASVPAPKATPQQATLVSSSRVQTVPNSEHLKAELSAAADAGAKAECNTCDRPGVTGATTEKAIVARSSPTVTISHAAGGAGGALWTLRRSVDETAVFFAVSSHGHMVSDLDASNIAIVDDNQPPQRVIQFIPQSKLPLRLGLLIDTSGSVRERFAFEKHAAAKFLQKVLNGSTDLGFVAGFASDARVTEDFSTAPTELVLGVEKLSNGGGTALFDAVSFACWKLAAYPDQERVARVLVILSDGEDNSSHRSLRQAIEEAENSGVSIYTVSTTESNGPRTDADQVLQLLAERSGGEAMFPGDMLTLEKSLDKLRELIRSRYLLAYKPAAFEPNGKYRSIRITATRDGKHLQVHARKGYYARLASPMDQP
jgi:Ca-activated chloride channel homolog